MIDFDRLWCRVGSMGTLLELIGSLRDVTVDCGAEKGGESMDEIMEY